MPLLADLARMTARVAEGTWSESREEGIFSVLFVPSRFCLRHARQNHRQDNFFNL
jgi:hypothetical protein